MVEEILFGRIFLGAHTAQTISKHVWARHCWHIDLVFSLLRSLREKCPNAEFNLVRIFLYSDQKKLCIWKLFTQLVFFQLENST